MKRLDKAFPTIVFLVVAAALYLILFPPGMHSKADSRRAATESRLRQIAIASAIYASDNDDHLPAAGVWMDALGPILKASEWTYRDSCMDKPAPHQYGFAYFRPISELKLSAIENPTQVPVSFQSRNTGWNATGGLELLPDKPRNASYYPIALLDGSLKKLSREEAIKELQAPKTR